jgi:hypothetical protein
MRISSGKPACGRSYVIASFGDPGSQIGTHRAELQLELHHEDKTGDKSETISNIVLWQLTQASLGKS